MRPVRWSKRADTSLASIFIYLAERNPEAAQKIAHRIADAGDALGEHSSGRPGPVPHSYFKSLPDVSYVISYRIDRRGTTETVVILDVIHSRRRRIPG